MEPSSLTDLCKFGAEVGTRLVRLSKNVDGMPSAVKSLGFEIWATAEVLCEFAVIVTRARKNVASPFFNDTALKSINESIETCDEIFHEAARAVVVAYQRLKELIPREKESKNKPAVDNKLYLSFGERMRWPLFQGRVRAMMEALMNAKMDIILHMLVFWVSWEAENKRRSTTSILRDLNTGTRIALVNQLWNNKVRRDQEHENSIPNLTFSPPSLSGSSAQPSIFSASRSNSSSPSSTSPSPTSSSGTVSNLSTVSSDTKLKKFGRFFAKAFGLKPKEEEESHEKVQYTPLLVKDDLSIQDDSLIHSRVPSGAPSYRSDISSNPDAPVLRKAKSIGPGGRGEYKSLLALTEGDPNALFQRPPPMKSTTWSAGPTKSFKQGVVLEWKQLMDQSDDMEWSNEEGELGQDYAQDPRILGRRLLYQQLSAATPYYTTHEHSESRKPIEMLLERWIEQGVTRTRVAEWEKVMNLGQRRGDESTALMPIEESLRFDFRRF